MADHIGSSKTELFPDVFGHIFVKIREMYLYAGFCVRMVKAKSMGENEMENMKIRYLETLAELYPTIAKASSEIINLQAKRNGAFSDRYPWRIRGFLPRIKKWVRLCKKEDQRSVRPYLKRAGTEGIGNTDLLSKRKDGSGKKTGIQHGGVV